MNQNVRFRSRPKPAVDSPTRLGVHSSIKLAREVTYPYFDRIVNDSHEKAGAVNIFLVHH